MLNLLETRSLLAAIVLLPALAAAQPDLTVNSVTGPATGIPGEMISARAVLANTGTAPAGAFKYTWFLSDNPVVTVSDQRLAPVGSVASLANGMMVTQSDVLALPAVLTAGTYWLGVCANYDPSAMPEFGISELTATNNCLASTTGVVISTGPVAVITTSLPAATQYAPYGFRLRAADGNGSYVWSQTGGTLPPGISLSAAGDLFGTPATAGSFAIDVKVTSGAGEASASLMLTVTTGALPLAVVDQDPPAAEFGRPYAANLVALGGKPPYVWTLKPATQLPRGLNLSKEGLIEGRATETGDFLFGVVCTDTVGATSSKELKLRVFNPATLRIATAGLATAYLNQSYLQVLQAVGGKPGYDWTLVRFQQLAENVTEQDGESRGDGKDSIPMPLSEIGLKIEDGGNGTDALRGIPTRAGLFLLTLRVADNGGSEDFAQLVLQIGYVEGLAITTTALPDAFVGHAYEAALRHNGTADTVVAFTAPCVRQSNSQGVSTCAAVDPSQSIPAGMVLEADGKVKGTPTAAPGNYAFLVKVSDAAGRQDVRSLSIRVRGDFLLEPSGGCSGTGLDPSAFGALIVAALGLRLRRQRR
jgi:hypothetical protein